jgi:hypothetical protein
MDTKVFKFSLVDEILSQCDLLQFILAKIMGPSFIAGTNRFSDTCDFD